jgi:hypothetical protein
VPRRIFGHKGEEVTGGWRELHNLYSSQNIIRVIRINENEMGNVASLKGMRNAHKILLGKPEEPDWGIYA